MGDTTTHTWIYNAKKKQLVNFIKENITLDELIEFLNTEDLRKIIVKSYSAKETKKTENLTDTETKVTDNSSAEEGSLSDEKKQESSFTDLQSGDIESDSSCEMDGERWIFKPKTEDWEAYVERLELFFETKDITDEKKKIAHLLTKIGPEMYKTIRDLCAPTKPKDKSYKDITELISGHVNPKRNEAMERCRFQQARQAPNENIADFIARLKELALHCKFKDLDSALRDQLVCGIAEHSTRVALFSEENLTYEKAMHIATTRESALRNAKNMDRPLQSSREASVHHVSSSQRFSGNKNSFKDYKEKKKQFK